MTNNGASITVLRESETLIEAASRLGLEPYALAADLAEGFELRLDEINLDLEAIEFARRFKRLKCECKKANTARLRSARKAAREGRQQRVDDWDKLGFKVTGEKPDGTLALAPKGASALDAQPEKITRLEAWWAKHAC